MIYGPGVIRGGPDEDDGCVIISEMVACAKVLALTALEVCSLDRDAVV